MSKQERDVFLVRFNAQTYTNRHTCSSSLPPSLCLSVCLSVSLCLCLCLSISVSVSVSVSLSLSLSLSLSAVCVVPVSCCTVERPTYLQEVPIVYCAEEAIPNCSCVHTRQSISAYLSIHSKVKTCSSLSVFDNLIISLA